MGDVANCKLGYFTQWNDAEHSTADNASSVPYYLQCHITRTYPMAFLFIRWPVCINTNTFLFAFTIPIDVVGYMNEASISYIVYSGLFWKQIKWNIKLSENQERVIRPKYQMQTIVILLNRQWDNSLIMDVLLGLEKSLPVSLNRCIACQESKNGEVFATTEKGLKTLSDVTHEQQMVHLA